MSKVSVINNLYNETCGHCFNVTAVARDIARVIATRVAGPAYGGKNQFRHPL